MSISRQQLAALPPDELRAVADMANDLIHQRDEAEKAQLWEEAITALRRYMKKADSITVRTLYDEGFDMDEVHSGGIGVIEEGYPT